MVRSGYTDERWRCYWHQRLAAVAQPDHSNCDCDSCSRYTPIYLVMESGQRFDINDSRLVIEDISGIIDYLRLKGRQQIKQRCELNSRFRFRIYERSPIVFYQKDYPYQRIR